MTPFSGGCWNLCCPNCNSETPDKGLCGFSVLPFLSWRYGIRSNTPLRLLSYRWIWAGYFPEPTGLYPLPSQLQVLVVNPLGSQPPLFWLRFRPNFFGCLSGAGFYLCDLQREMLFSLVMDYSVGCLVSKIAAEEQPHLEAQLYLCSNILDPFLTSFCLVGPIWLKMTCPYCGHFGDLLRFQN